MQRPPAYRWTAIVAALVAMLVPVGLAPAWGAAPAKAPPITVPFDHLTTGFELDGVHRDLPCESCHLNAVFKGTPTQCGTCHISGSPYNATPKTALHIPTTNNCDACHNTFAFRPDVHFDHAEVLGSCVSCHNGNIAQGEGPTHPQTSQDCQACHTVMAWNPAKAVDHTQIPLAVAGFCIVCHNGVQASGKPANHIATNLECGDCHLTTSWLGASFDHTGITSGCVSCHNGTKAVGKQGNHMPTTNVCENCHTTGIGTKTPSWAPSQFDHTQMTVTTCQTCHSGTVKITTGFVSGQPTNHVPPIPSTIDCGVCHGNTPTAETWAVLAVDIPTLHSGLNVNNCLLCHAGETFAGVPAPYIPMSTSGVSPTKSTPLSPVHIPILAGADCSSCHAAAYLAGGFGPSTAMSAAKHAFVSGSCVTCHEAGKAFYTGSGTALQTRPANHTAPNMAAPNDCSGCHTTTDWNSTTFPAGHMPNPGNQACGVCHTALPTNYTTLASNAILHTGISGGCSQCHGPTAPLTFYNNYSPKSAVLAPPHIPYLAGTECNACHSTSTYAVGGFSGLVMTAATHTFVSSTCDQCHDTGSSFYVGSGTPLQLRPADHLSSSDPRQVSGDCSLCHTTSSWGTTVLPPGHMPNPGNQACSVCHTAAPNNYTTLASNPVLHTGITNGCIACHGYLAAITFYNNFTPKSAVLSPSHIPLISGTTPCESCHSASVFTSFSGTTMSAAKHAFVTTSCAVCHEAGLTFYPGAGLNLQGRPADHTPANMAAPNDCNGCHETTDWNSTSFPVGHMPNPGNQNCNICHTAAPTNYTTLATNTVLHTGITNGCITCHGYSAAITFYNNFTPKSAVLSPNHIPLLSASTPCESCHSASTFTSFSGTTMSAAKHAFVATTCDTCHEAGLTFYPGAALNLQGRPVDHKSTDQLAPNDCSGCHETTDWNSNKLPAGHMPNPASQACTVCHTAAPTNYTTLATNAVLHTGIAGNCAQCHGSTTTTLTFYDNFTVKSGVLSPNHIPILGGSDCSGCHASSSYAAGGFGGTTMSVAKHAYVTTACSTCHEAGLTFYPGAALDLQGRPTSGAFNHLTSSDPNQVSGDCSLCHNTTDWASNVPPAGHMPNPAGNACAVCHTTPSGAPGTPDYTQYSLSGVHSGSIIGSCSICHSGSSWIGVPVPIKPKPSSGLAPPHIPVIAGADCGSCHNTTGIAIGGFANTTMSAAKHAFVATTCNTCHEAGLSFYPGAALGLQGRPADHTAGNQAAPNDCSGCHETTDWNSNTLPAGHMPNPGNQSCNTCHTAAPANYTTLASNTVLHTGISSGCITCHGYSAGITFYNNFTPKSAVLSPSHIPLLSSTTPCESCHSASTFTSFSGTTMSAAKHAFVATTCDTCHESGLTFYPGAALNLQGRPADHTPTNMAKPNDCNGCHETTDWNSTAYPVGHMPNPGNQACTVCHTAAPSNYTTLATNAVLHTGITNGCNACHGYSAALTFYNNFTPKSAVLSPAHIPLLAASTPCESCHSASTFTSFSGTTMSAAKHAFVATTCDTCHESGLTFYPGAALNLQGRPADHTAANQVKPNDCNSCHETTDWNSTVLPGGHMPNPANQACTVCHTAAPTNYTTLAANSVLHTGITTACNSCHGYTAALTFFNNFTPKSAVLSPSHIPLLAATTPCESCHSTTNFATGAFGPMNMTQATHAFVAATCNTCHEAGLSFYMGSASPALQGRPADHTSGQMVAPNQCSICHTTANWNSTALPSGHMPNPGNQACTVCHTSAPSDYTKLAANPVLHTGITTGCIACHGSPAGALTFYNNFTPKSAVLSPVHIPTSTTPCEACHSTTTFTVGGFSGTTMTAAKHTSMFAVIGSTCDACHNKVTPALSFYGVTNLTTRPSDHNSGNKATQDCKNCHSPSGWGGGAAVRKAAAATGTTRTTVSTVVAAPATSAAASVIGSPSANASAALAAAALGRLPGGVRSRMISHAGVTASCSSCHNGTLATAKGATHIASTSACENCHVTTAWLPARVDHRSVIGSCASCHNGVIASGKSVKHVVTTQDCSTCHGTLAWLPASFSHQGVIGTCQSCHNGVTAAGKPMQHLATTVDCGSCHNTQTWTGAVVPAPALAPTAPAPRVPVTRPVR